MPPLLLHIIVHVVQFGVNDDLFLHHNEPITHYSQPYLQQSYITVPHNFPLFDRQHLSLTDLWSLYRRVWKQLLCINIEHSINMRIICFGILFILYIVCILYCILLFILYYIVFDIIVIYNQFTMYRYLFYVILIIFVCILFVYYNFL